jgi:Fe-S cluster assembly ATP-binding protein
MSASPAARKSATRFCRWRYSGLDIDALRIAADGVNALRSPERAMVVITHYQRLLNYIIPDFVHVMSKGRVVKSGGKELALELEEFGYTQFEDAA